jgi:hypothetical protein
MDPISLTSIIITIVGSALGAVAKRVTIGRKKRGLAINADVSLEQYRTANSATNQVPAPAPPPPPPPARRLSPGVAVLFAFAVIIIVFGGFSLFYYWPLISSNGESLMFALWLFLAMIAGMFVQVLAANYRAGRALFDVSASQLIFPLLFALIVYYPIWALAASSPHNLFSFYAAFLNGYFWESVVSAAKAPTPNADPTK